MSEYQWIHFLSVDSPVTDSDLKFMRRQSTRAEISAREFTNEYHFGEFRGNSDEMLRRGYDIFVHLSDFGYRRIDFRLPELPCSQNELEQFASDDEIIWTKDKKGTAGILSINPDIEPGMSSDWLTNAEDYADRFVPLRDMLICGDLRPLYVVWLATCFDENQTEPPIPAGLGQPSDAVDAMLELYEIPDDLLQEAAKAGGELPEPTATDAQIRTWLGRQKKAELQEITLQLLRGNHAEHRTTLNQIRREAGLRHPRLSPGSRTFGELVTAADVALDRW